MSDPAGADVTRFLDAWFAVRQLIQAANFNRFQSAGLSATQFMTLNLLPPGRGSIGMGELARQMNLKPATVARTVDSLEARRLLARRQSTSDRRQVLVSITPAGAKLQNAAASQFRTHMSALFRAMTAADRAQLLNGLESLVRAADAPRANAAGATGSTQATRPRNAAISEAPTRVRRAAVRGERSSPRSRPA